MSLEVQVDHDQCAATGVCVNWLPKVFQWGANGLAEVADPTAASDDEIMECAEACPTEAIRVRVVDEQSDAAEPSGGEERGTGDE